MHAGFREDQCGWTIDNNKESRVSEPISIRSISQEDYMKWRPLLIFGGLHAPKAKTWG